MKATSGQGKFDERAQILQRSSEVRLALTPRRPSEPSSRNSSVLGHSICEELAAILATRSRAGYDAVGTVDRNGKRGS